MRRLAWDNRKGEEKDMKNTMEIRWHGRGGQGAKTAALLLADVAFKTGKYVQGFPEYGPERMGAPITAYNRISEEPITITAPSFPRPMVTSILARRPSSTTTT